MNSLSQPTVHPKRTDIDGSCRDLSEPQRTEALSGPGYCPPHAPTSTSWSVVASSERFAKVSRRLCALTGLKRLLWMTLYHQDSALRSAVRMAKWYKENIPLHLWSDHISSPDWSTSIVALDHVAGVHHPQCTVYVLKRILQRPKKSSQSLVKCAADGPHPAITSAPDPPSTQLATLPFQDAGQTLSLLDANALPPSASVTPRSIGAHPNRFSARHA